MKPTGCQRVEITADEVAYLTLGSWRGIAKGFELEGYCHECDDAEAKSMVTDYFLDLSSRCVTAEVNYKCCGDESTISFAVLEEKRLLNVLTMSHE